MITLKYSAFFSYNKCLQTCKMFLSTKCWYLFIMQWQEEPRKHKLTVFSMTEQRIIPPLTHQRWTKYALKRCPFLSGQDSPMPSRAEWGWTSAHSHPLRLVLCRLQCLSVKGIPDDFCGSPLHVLGVAEHQKYYPLYLEFPALYSCSDFLGKMWNGIDCNHFFLHSLTLSSQAWEFYLLVFF